MGSPETAPGGDNIPRIINWLIDETLAGGAPSNTVEGSHTPEAASTFDPLIESRRQAQTAWQNVSRLLEAGQTISPDANTPVGLLIYTLIGDAIERQDTQQVDEYVAALSGLSIRRDIKTASYVRAMSAGYPTAERTLRSALQDEWSSTPLEVHGNPDPATTSPLLQATVRVCQQNGDDPTSLINEYSLNPTHAVQLRLIQLRQLTMAADHEERLAIEERIADDFDSLSTVNTLAVAKQALDTITHPTLRLRIMQRTLDVVEASGQVQSAGVQHFVEKVFGELLWSDPSGDDPTLQRMAQTIEANHQGSAAPFVDAWEVDQRIFAGSTPDEIIAFIDSRTTPALSGDSFGIEADLALMNRDTLLQKYAVLYAASDNLVGARLCLAHIGDGRAYEAALYECIPYGSTTEELQALRPPSAYGNPDGSDIPSFALALADCNGDTEKLCAIATDIAREIASDDTEQRAGRRIAAPTSQLSSFLNNNKRTLYLYSAYKRVESQDPLRSYRLAIDLLELLRAQESQHSPGVIQFLSDALVRDGDTTELRAAYNALPRDGQGNRPLRGIIRLLNLQSSDPLPEWLRDELDFACD